MTGEGLVIVVPLLHRAHRFPTMLASARATVPDARVLFVCTPHDAAVIAAVDATGVERLMVPWHPVGDFARKTNNGYRHTTEPLIFTGADDIVFQPGWFEAATAKLGPGIGVVGTNDLANPRVMRGDHATHVLVTREYADRHGVVDQPGAIFCELYPHEMTDDELVATAKKRKAWAWAGDSHVEHFHPSFKPHVPMDASYAEQGRRIRAGRPIFRQRRHLWA